MGCGKSKQAVATVDNAAVLSRKKSSSGSKSLKDVERNHNADAGTNEYNPTNNDNGNKVSEVKRKENENGGNSISTELSQKKSGGGSTDLKECKIRGNDGEDKNVGIDTSNSGNGSSDVHASGDHVKNDIEAKTKAVQEENQEGKESNKSEEVIGLDRGDKKNQEVESDTPSHGALKQSPVAENVEVDDAVVEEEKNGDETKDKIANEDAGVKNEIKEEQTPETDVITASTPEEKAEDKAQPESSFSMEDADTN